MEKEMSENTANLVDEGYIKTELKKYNLPDARLSEMRKKYLDVKVLDPQDKENYERAKKHHQDIKNIRFAIEHKRKELKASSLEFGKAVDSEAKRLTACVLEMEDHLLAQRKIVEDEKERIRKEKEEAIRLQREEEERKRKEAEEAERKRIEEEQRKEEARLEKIRQEQEAIERKQREAQERIDAENRRIEEEKERLEKEKQEAEQRKFDAENDRRFNALVALGLEYCSGDVTFNIGDVEIDWSVLCASGTYTNEEFDIELKGIALDVEAEKKRMADLEAQRQKEEEERRQKEIEEAKKKAAEEARQAEVERQKKEQEAKEVAAAKAEAERKRKLDVMPDIQKIEFYLNGLTQYETPVLRTNDPDLRAAWESYHTACSQAEIELRRFIEKERKEDE